MKYLLATLTVLCGFALSASIGKKSDVPKQAVEVGKVRWSRDFDDALRQSGSSGKPVFLLFQEVPGCAGCKKFGKEVLSDPLLVEAIEEAFVPMLVHNNTSGDADEEILKRYREPAWNYQVVRFVDSKGKDLIVRKDRVWETGALAARMVAALEKSKRKVPNYLRALVSAGEVKQAAFAMHCFWTGECALGKIDGVVETEAGWLEGREVTLVKYNPEQVTLKAITSYAEKAKCSDKVYASLGKEYRAAKSSDQSKQIQRLGQKKLAGLTEIQRTKLNALWHSDREKALSWLSPKQRVEFGEE